MSVKFANNAHSTLASSVSTSATSITVASGHGARFPSLTGSEFFYATLIDTSNNLEIVKVTARSTDVLTVTRAQESTSARAFASGDRIELRVTAQGLTDATTIAADQIVNSMIATDAVNADSIAANAVGASEINVSGNGSAGQYLESDGDGTMTWSTVSAVVRKIHTFRHSSRVSVGSGANNNAFTFSSTFTPLDAANNSFIVHLTVPSNHAGNDFGSHGVRFDGSSNTYDFNLRGVMHIDVGGPHMSVEGQHYFIAAGEMAQQTFTLRYRYYQSSSNPDTINVNTSDNSRVGGQTSTELIIIEYKNA